MLSASATPTQKAFAPGTNAASAVSSTALNPRSSFERDGGASLQPQPSGGGLAPPLSTTATTTNGAPSVRNLSASAVTFGPRGSSLNPSIMPGSFSSDLRSQMGPPSRAQSRADVYAMDKVRELDDDDDPDAAALAIERTLSNLREQLNREMKIKEGSENMLEALNTKKAKQSKEQRARVEAELNASNARIKELRNRISEAQRTRAVPTTPTRTRTADAGSFFHQQPQQQQQQQQQQAQGAQPQPQGGPAGLRSPPSVSRSGAGSDMEEQTESPTFALAELLQALEVEGMTPEYYVSRANGLVDLFKRHPTLKYDLVWSVFGLRMQVMLLSESREVVAAGYRMTRYAISDVSSLKRIRSLNTDCLVVTSLIKDRKADVEREQALKFVRAFLDVKDGVREVSRAVVRTIAAIAEQGEDERPSAPEHMEDRLRSICIETLAEILVRDPQLLAASGGLAPLSKALANGTYKAPESLAAAFLFLLDVPQRRKYLRAGYDLDVLFTTFTDTMLTNETILKQNSKAIASALKSWSGLMTLSMYDFRAVRSLISSMLLPHPAIRETVVDLLYSLLRIKSPAWATSFLAGRRLTTYGRVATLKSTTQNKSAPATYADEDGGEQNFVDHYTALLLAVLIKAGLLPSLLQITQGGDNPIFKRKTTLLIGEVLKLSSRLLPPSWSSELQLLPELFSAATQFTNENHFIASGVVYQISSVSRTLYRSQPVGTAAGGSGTISSSTVGLNDLSMLDEQPKNPAAVIYDDATFRQLLLDTNVLNSSNYSKWNWEVMLKVIDGPLQNGRRLEEAIKASKFMKRIMSFYRPFKYKFTEIKNTRNNQKYVKVGCALVHALLQSPEGVRFLADSKLMRQIAECLAQCDPNSGLTAQFPMFSRDRLTDTLCWGYIPIIGVLSGDRQGLMILDRWRMFNMMYHIFDLKQRPDLIKLLLMNFDYTLVGHPRVLASKAMIAGTKDIRITATGALRKYAVRPAVTSSALSSQPTPGQGAGQSQAPQQGEAEPDWKWAIKQLVWQLYDPEIEVAAQAVKALEKACNKKANLEFVVQCKPTLDHLGEISAPLLLRFLSTSIGYHYLDGLDYISNEMDDWFLGRNDSYVSVIEAALAKAFAGDSHPSSSGGGLGASGGDDLTPHPFRGMGRFEYFDADYFLLGGDGELHDSHVPPHFYRELTRTAEGCRLLEEKGHFDEFASTIREYGMQSDDPELITKVKGCLWAVGNVGSIERGGPFLESCNVVADIIQIAQSHEVMSLRGTAFFVLGLISRSWHGLEILSEHGWDANTIDDGNSLGFCLPTDLGKLFSLQPWRTEAVGAISLPDTQKTTRHPPPPITPRPPILLLEKQPLFGPDNAPLPTNPSGESEDTILNRRINELVVDLGNMVLFNRAMTELHHIKAKKASGFSSPRQFRQVMALMEYNHYNLPIRNRVVKLFDKSVLRKIVFDEDGGEDAKEDDDDESTDGSDEDSEDEASPPRGGQRRNNNSHEDARSESSDEGRTERQRSVSEPEYVAPLVVPKRSELRPHS